MHTYFQNFFHYEIQRHYIFLYAISSVKSQNNGDVRLAQTSDNFIYEGRLEIFMNGKWGTVCNKTSNLDSVADTACRQLGYKGAFSYGRTVTSLDYPIASNSTPIHIGSIDCPLSASFFFSKTKFVLKTIPCICCVAQSTNL